MEKPIPELKEIEIQSAKKMYKYFCKKFKRFILGYFSITSMDGLYHLTTNGIFHRLFWLFLFVTSMISCYFVTVNLFKTRELLVLNEKSVKSTFHIPFPAITVCSTVTADHRIINYEKTGMRLHQLKEDDDE